LFVFVVCFFGQAVFPSLMLAAMGVGFVFIAGAWAYDGLGHRSG